MSSYLKKLWERIETDHPEHTERTCEQKSELPPKNSDSVSNEAFGWKFRKGVRKFQDYLKLHKIILPVMQIGRGLMTSCDAMRLGRPVCNKTEFFHRKPVSLTPFTSLSPLSYTVKM